MFKGPLTLCNRLKRPMFKGSIYREHELKIRLSSQTLSIERKWDKSRCCWVSRGGGVILYNFWYDLDQWFLKSMGLVILESSEIPNCCCVVGINSLNKTERLSLSSWWSVGSDIDKDLWRCWDSPPLQNIYRLLGLGLCPKKMRWSRNMSISLSRS